MSTEEIKQKANQAVLAVLPNVRADELLEDQNIFSLGLNSITAMSLITSLEETFDVIFETSEINFENFQTITDIVNLIQKKEPA